jgi:N-formylglutamate deformylase
LVIDCHSMPSAPAPRGLPMPDVVLGDVHGTSCAPPITAFVESRLGQLGLRLRRNDPYAGGYITRHYGRPRDGVHVLQIEFLRALYMDEAAFQKSAAFDGLRTKLTAFLASMAQAAAVLLPPPAPGLANAAE